MLLILLAVVLVAYGLLMAGNVGGIAALAYEDTSLARRGRDTFLFYRLRHAGIAAIGLVVAVLSLPPGPAGGLIVDASLALLALVMAANAAALLWQEWRR